jgi:hypothetical protein
MTFVWVHATDHHGPDIRAFYAEWTATLHVMAEFRPVLCPARLARLPILSPSNMFVRNWA